MVLENHIFSQLLKILIWTIDSSWFLLYGIVIVYLNFLTQLSIALMYCVIEKIETLLPYNSLI